jgi:hypothetical protein
MQVPFFSDFIITAKFIPTYKILALFYKLLLIKQVCIPGFRLKENSNVNFKEGRLKNFVLITLSIKTIQLPTFAAVWFRQLAD